MDSNSTLDPNVQNAIASAQAAIAAAEAAEKETDEFLANLDKEYAALQTARGAIEQELNDEAVAIVQKMDEDTLQFLGDIAESPAQPTPP